MPMLANPLEDLKRPELKSNNYIAYVVDNVDESGKESRQRVKIRIPMFHRNVPDEHLPWAIPDTNNNYANAGNGVGSVNIPPMGSKLWITIPEKDPHNPRYGGSPSTDDVTKDHEAFKEDYPHTRSVTDLDNNIEKTNVEAKTQSKTHSSGTTVHIDANGTMSITTAGDYNLGCNGNVNISASGDVNINGKKIKLNEGSVSPTTPTNRPRPSLPSQSGNTGY